jgi:cytochrome c553
MTDEQIKSIDTRTLGYLHFARAIIAARDKQWADMLGEPVSKCAQCHREYTHGKSTAGCPKCAKGLAIPESEFREPLYALKQGKPE